MRDHLFGLKYLRFLSVSVVISMHSLVMVGQLSGHDFAGGFGEGGLIGLFLLMIPATAGAIFRVSLEPNIADNRLVNYPMKNALLLFLGLGALESLKGWVSVGAGWFFSWNVLHCVGLSFVVITWIARHSVKWVFPVGVAVLVFTPLIRSALAPFEIVAIRQVFPFFHSNFLNFWLIFGVSFGFLYVLQRIFQWRPPKPALRRGALLVLSVSLILCLWRLESYETDMPSFVATVHNLPVGFLIGDPHQFHVWPLVPWLSTVIYGFSLFDSYLRARRKEGFRLWVFVVSVGMLLYFFAFSFSDFRRDISIMTLWSSQVFQAKVGLIIGVLGAFGLNVLFCDLIERKWRFLAFDFMVVYGRSILWIYLFVTSIAGWWLARPFAVHLPFRMALFVFPLFMHGVCYFLGLGVVRFLGERTFHIKLVKKGEGLA